MFAHCCIGVLILQYVYGANILFVAISPSISHQIVFQPIWKELSLRGHHIEVLTTDPLRDPTLTNLTEYDLSSMYNGLKVPQKLLDFYFTKPNFGMVFTRYRLVYYGYYKYGEKTLQHPEMQRFLNTKTKFDVAIVEYLFPTMTALGAKFKCPIIGVASLGVPLVALDSMGNPSHPITSPDHNLPLTRDMTFRERLMSALILVYVRVWYHLVVLPREDRIVKKYIGEDLPYIGDIERNVSLLLLNRNPVFHRFLPVGPSVIELSGITVKRSKPDLDPELQKFLDGSRHGVIYFSLGSHIQTKYLPQGTIEKLLEVFKELPYNIVFKSENDTLPGKPDNMFTAKWLPQFTVLDHPNTKLFITQGGLQSSEEAIITEVPIIGFPMVNDQVHNIDTFVKYGAGICLDIDHFSVKEFNASVYEIMTNSGYKENMKTLSKIMYDKPQDGLEKAIWWIEYVIRHKGARHLRSPILDIPWWQYFMLDVSGFVLGFLAITSFVIYFSIKGIFWLGKNIQRVICSVSRKYNRKQAKKRQ